MQRSFAVIPRGTGNHSPCDSHAVRVNWFSTFTPSGARIKGPKVRATVIDCVLTLHATIDDLLPVMRRGDLVGFQRIFNRLADGRRLPPDELTAAVGELSQVLAYRPEGVFTCLALVAGAYVEWGGSPLARRSAPPAPIPTGSSTSPSAT
jgi:hypothetical protein